MLGDDLAKVTDLYPTASVEFSNFDESAFVYEVGQLSTYVRGRRTAVVDLCRHGSLLCLISHDRAAG